MPRAEYELYKRIKLLGQGSYGKAYLVQVLSDNSYCVIKQMDLSAMNDEEKRDTLNEAKVLEALKHPNIVRFREVYKTKRGKLCIVMDYADGGDLSTKIKAQKTHFSENQIIDWFTQICLGMKHVHDRKILHRDLKAQNVFLTKNSMVKLGDFGIAKVLAGTNENAMTVVGTPYYLSPEIIDEKPYNYKSDIWSLGVLLYELCSLRPPFDGQSLPALMRKISKGHYSPIPSVYSKGLKELVDKLLRINPLERPTINQILNMPLIQDRIRNFLSESIRVNEFSHTMIHDQQFASIDLKFENIKQVINEGPMPSHLLRIQLQKEKEQLHHQHHVLPPLDPSPKALLGFQNNQPKVQRSPIVQSIIVHHDPSKQIKSPQSDIRQLPPISRSHLPPIYSPQSQLQSEHRSPALNSAGGVRPVGENKTRHSLEFAEPPFPSVRESPQYNPRVLPHSDKINSHVRVITSAQALVPLVQAGANQSPKAQVRVSHLPQINPEKPKPSKVGVKREILKGLEKINVVSGPAVAAFGENKKSPKKSPKDEEKENKNMNQNDNESEGKNENKFNIFYKDLLKEVKEKDNNKESSKILDEEQNHTMGKEKMHVKNHVEEVLDIEAMVLELNRLVSRVGHEIDAKEGTPSSYKNSRNELPDNEEEVHKDEDREDDLEEHTTEKDDHPPRKENQFFPDVKGMEKIKANLEEELGHEKFKKAYEIVVEMIDNDEDFSPSEGNRDYYKNLFPFLGTQEIHDHLYNVFTYALMSEWFTQRKIQA